VDFHNLHYANRKLVMTDWTGMKTGEDPNHILTIPDVPALITAALEYSGESGRGGQG
jgi:hypothetical protein